MKGDFNFTPHEKECAGIIDQLVPIIVDGLEIPERYVGPEFFQRLVLRLAELTDKEVKVKPASHTPNGYDPRWLPPINEALTDRYGDIVITDISDKVWEQFIGPMLDAIERDEVEVSK